jgi:hypothetical protein
MFFRTKTSGTRSYLQIVENRWEDGRPKQRRFSQPSNLPISHPIVLGRPSFFPLS